MVVRSVQEVLMMFVPVVNGLVQVGCVSSSGRTKILGRPGRALFIITIMVLYKSQITN